ncbi:MAG: hypothetical protein ACXVBW_10100, partial [Bdellovibrionota bacterium]
SIPIAWAQNPHETVVYSGAPDPDRIASWSTRPDFRTYVIQMKDPASTELEPLLHLGHADRLQIEVSRFPGEDAISTWHRLAAQGAELVAMGAGIPTEWEISHLNSIGFAKVWLVLTEIPGLEEAKRVSLIRSPVSILLSAGMYPRYVDKPVFLALPSSVPLTLANNYWPYYTHMDVMNMLPQVQHLRVSGMFPPADEVPYLQNCKNVRDVTVETDSGPDSPKTWEVFGKWPVNWSIRNQPPSDSALAAFEESRKFGPRRLTVDTDTPISAEQRRRLELSPLPVEWVHAE